MQNTDEAQKDVTLLEQVLMRLAVAQEDQLEGQLNNLLVPIIAKLDSPHEVVRKKVLDVLMHINKRVKPLTQIKLPIKSLLDHLLQSPSTSNTASFTVLYLEMGFGRCSVEERASIAPSLLLNISKRPAQLQHSLLHMATSVIEKIQVPSDDKEREEQLSFAKDSKDVAIVLEFFLQVLLATPTDEVPFCHSVKSFRGIMSKITKDQLINRKLGILEFLWSSRLFPDTLVAPHFIVASCDPNHAVVRKGEDGLKRLGKLNYDDKNFISKLFALFQGKPLTGEDAVRPAGVILRAKIFHYLNRSELAANFFPQSLQVIFEGVYGQDTTIKVKQGAMTFVQWVFRTAGDAQLKNMGPIILTGLLKLLTTLKEEPVTTETNDLKSFTYSAIGLLSKRQPNLISADMNLITMFFQNLISEDQRVKPAIQDGLTMMCRAFENATHLHEKVQELLLDNVDKSEYQARFMAVYYANRLFKFDSVPARYLCLLAVDDNKLEVKEEASRGLRPFVQKDGDIIPDPSQPYPSFEDLVLYIAQLTSKRLETIKQNTSGKAELLYTPRVHEEILNFLRTTFKVSAAVLEKDMCAYTDYLMKNKKESIDEYIKLLDSGIAVSSGRGDLHHRACTSLLELISYQPQQISSYYTSKFDWLKTFLFAGAYESRELVARILGLVSTYLETVVPTIKDLLAHTLPATVSSELSIDKSFGSSHALGFIISRHLQLKKDLAKELIVDALWNLYHLLGHVNTLLIGAAVQAIGYIGRYAPLPIEEGTAIDEKERDKAIDKLNKRVVVYKIVKLLSSPESKVIERSAVALSNLSLGDRHASFEDDAIEGLFTVGKLKNEEIHFTIGEALSVIGAGWASTAAADQYLEPSPLASVEENPVDNKVFLKILTQILSVHIMKPVSRSSACIWLLSIVKHAGKHSTIQSKLPVIQQVFSYLLSDNNEVTQEVASRGLVFVYDYGDAAMKKELVNGLVETLQSGKKSGFKLTEDTEIFPEGSLGQTPEGTQLSTYKELCNLASEMGKPDLVYKFMNLASHHSLWNSKKGAAFAATSIMTQAQDQIKPILPSLVPKLYRASYDPNPRIASSMNNILKALVDPKKAVNDYFPQILAELLEGLNSNLWRVRESSCTALADALQGRGFEEVHGSLQDLWYRCFRVLDDMKESVRKAAAIALRGLSALTTRLCDPSYTTAKQGEEAINIALPFLLNKGLVNDADEVKAFSLAQIQKIAKVAGNLLVPHVPELVGVLLEAMTSLEPAQFNYMSFHTEKMNVSQEQLEEARIAISKVSPISDTLDLCAKYVDEKNADALTSKLAEIIKTSVGMQSKVGTARFIVSLVISKSAEIKPYSEKLLNALLAAYRDRSPSVRKAYANAIASIAKFAPTKAVGKLVNNLVNLYKDFEHDESRMMSAVAVNELVKRSPDAVKGFYVDLLPISFLGKNDPSEDIAKIFKEVFDELSAGGLRQFLPEVVKYISDAMEAQSWIMKKQGAATIKQLADSLGNEIKSHLDTLLKLVVDGIPGRVWKGKESLLSALSSIASSCKEELREKSTSLVDLVLKECKKNDKEYRRHAVMCLASLLKTWSDLNLYEQVKTQLFELATEELKTDDSDADPKDKPLVLLTKGAAFQALGNAWPLDSEIQSRNVVEFVQMMTQNITKNVWNIRVDILNSLTMFLTRVKKELLTADLVKQLLPVLFETLSDQKYAVIRAATLDVLAELVNKTEDTELILPYIQELNTQLTNAGVNDTTLQNKVEKIKSQITDQTTKKRKN